MSNKKSDDIDVKMYAAFSCVDCGQEFQTREELEEHETKHQDLLRTDKATTTDKTDNPMNSIE